VNWYNGTPNEENNPWYNKATEKYSKYFKDVKKVVIIGQGNVAIDLARILGKNIEDLNKFDVPKKYNL
jgi:hypothetical protein